VASGLGEAANAAAEMRLALQVAPQDAGLLLAAAVAEREAGQLDDALHHVQAAGNTAAAQELAGDIQERRGAYVEAANAYQAAVALAPDREDYRIALALELVQHQAFEPAIQVLQRSAPLFPKSARLRTLLGIAHYAIGGVNEAEASLTDALELDPKLEPAAKYLGRIAAEDHRAPPKRTVDVLCHWDAVLCNALKLRLAMEKDDAVLRRRTMEALRAAPADSALARCELGYAYQAAGQLNDAQSQMESCVRLDPSPQNHYRLGRIYSRLGLEDLARRQMELRKAAAARLNEQVERRENAVAAFRYILQ
jgi:Putative Zn-dependent protease, contains TPR repeats